MSTRQLTSDSIVILVFPPGCGGNHLSNLLSLSDIFQQQFKSNDYFLELQEKYKTGKDKGNHHFGILENLRIINWEQTYAHFNKNKGVPIVCCHAVEYYNFLNNNLNQITFDSYRNKNIVLFSFPKENSIAYKRFFKLRQGEGVDVTDLKLVFSLDEYKILYGKNNFDSKLCLKFPQLLESGYQSQLNNIIEFDTESFVTENGFKYVQDFFKIVYNVDIPNEADTLHRYWYQTITSQII